MEASNRRSDRLREELKGRDEAILMEKEKAFILVVPAS
jgi:hypothetical protein